MTKCFIQLNRYIKIVNLMSKSQKHLTTKWKKKFNQKRYSIQYLSVVEKKMI